MNSELVRFKRHLKLELPPGQSAFLWGARKTGKSTYLEDAFPHSVRYDLLKTDIHIQLAKEPYRLREELLVLSKDLLQWPVIIDEIQKVPALLDEVHWLIENAKIGFILCGSSARKLKRGAANLLGGRAWGYNFYPLVYPEIPNFDLLRALNNGLIPSHYLMQNARRPLKAYVQDYLLQEIQGEGLVRNLPTFARFFDAVGFTHGELTNFSNIARECGVNSKVVKDYYQILVDTLLGYFIYPYAKRKGRQVIQSVPKFYLFDTGVANILTQKRINGLKGVDAGKSFEHFILMELLAYRGLEDRDFDITFWRTKTGLEVDFILGDAEIAIEVKISESINKSDLRGMSAFQEEFNPKKSYVVCPAPRPRKIKLSSNAEVIVHPWELFLQQLWAGEII